MKRFWLVLLSLGLIVAFSTSAMAVDVKFSGEYYAAGLYLSNTGLSKDGSVVLTTGSPYFMDNEKPSTAFYYQRLRLNTTFIVHPGLFLMTRADIMERAWGAARTAPGTTADSLSAGTTAENENIAIDLVYLTYISPIGIFSAGYQIDGAWGTVFGDSGTPTPKATYYLPIGSFGVGLQIGKAAENSKTAKNFTSTTSDADNSFYTGFVRYKDKTIEAGFLAKYFNYMSNRPSGFRTNYTAVLPYAKAQLGPVFVQAELIYAFGKRIDYEGSGDDRKMGYLSGWIDATADFNMFYAGGTFAYMSGDKYDTDKFEGDANGGLDWNPCLIMFNSELGYWAGYQPGAFAVYMPGLARYGVNDGGMTNAWFGQLRAGVRPIDKLNILATVSYAKADQKPMAGWVDKEYGWEVDMTATYKITNNLSYMLGGGYLFTGDYFKGIYEDADLADNFMVINKLTLTF